MCDCSSSWWGCRYPCLASTSVKRLDRIFDSSVSSLVLVVHAVLLNDPTSSVGTLIAPASTCTVLLAIRFDVHLCHTRLGFYALIGVDSTSLSPYTRHWRLDV